MDRTKQQPEIAVKIENVSKTFLIPHQRRVSLHDHLLYFWKKNPKEQFRALSDISFDIYKGEFFGIIGRNGSGKSTLLKLIARIYSPDKGGIVSVNGTLSPFLELGVGFHPELTARENVYMNGAILGLRKAHIDTIFDEIIAFAELEEFVDQKLKYFSSGMQVRLAFSVAIRADAEILLLDEVLAVGDARFQTKCFETFRSLKKQGKTIIFVSHDLSTVRQFCDRVAYIKDAKLQCIGAPNTVLEQYVFSDYPSKQETDRVEVLSSVEKPILISKLNILSGSNIEQTSFFTGDDVIFQVYIHSQIPLSMPNIGFILYDENDTYVFGTNTQLSGVQLRDIKPGENTFTITLSNIPLLKGTYSISIALADESYQTMYDWKEKCWKFTVSSRTNDIGLVALPISFSS